MNLPITPLKHRRVSEEVAEQLREAIFSGKLKPGNKLPPERELARQFAVSRLVLREALRSLEQTGLLIVKRGYAGGAFVSEMDRSAVSRSLSTMIRLGETSVDDLSEARLIYEPEITRLAAQRATDEDLAALKQVLDEQKVNLTGDRFGQPTNLSFHRIIAQATRNPVLVILVDAVMEPVRDAVAELKLPRGANEKTLSRHERLYRAIQRRKPDLAYKIMLEHVMEVREMLKKAYARSR
jgi:GntR family transcriptional repressor for pyruvate dehydrogenase complex